MKRRHLSSLSVILAVTTLAGCAVPGPQQRQRLDRLVGRSPVDVVREFGVPSRSFTTEDRIFLAYVDETSSYYGGAPGWGGGYGGGWAGGYGGWGWGGGFGSGYDRSACQTIFEIVQGRVTAWSLHGDGC